MTSKKPEPLTSVTVAQLLFFGKQFSKKYILTSLEAILERFVFKILKFRALTMEFFHVVQYGFYTSFSIYEQCNKHSRQPLWLECASLTFYLNFKVCTTNEVLCSATSPSVEPLASMTLKITLKFAWNKTCTYICTNKNTKIC